MKNLWFDANNLIREVTANTSAGFTNIPIGGYIRDNGHWYLRLSGGWDKVTPEDVPTHIRAIALLVD